MTGGVPMLETRRIVENAIQSTDHLLADAAVKPTSLVA